MGEEVQVTDGLGRTPVFPEQPQRFVIAGRATPLIVDAFYLNITSVT